MKKWELESFLQKLLRFENPDILKEQYSTPGNVLADFLWDYGHNFQGKNVLDLGCGTGILSLGALMCGAANIVAIDIDPTALELFRQNMNDNGMGDAPITLVEANVLEHNFGDMIFDIVILNPPFGTKHNAGIDSRFLEIAIAHSTGLVYSFHKSSTRSHFTNFGVRHGFSADLVKQYSWVLENTYKFHKKRNMKIFVDLWEYTREASGTGIRKNFPVFQHPEEEPIRSGKPGHRRATRGGSERRKNDRRKRR
ncbi:hypothetical protein PCE1_002317 [Barthelona sp. PCE]